MPMENLSYSTAVSPEETHSSYGSIQMRVLHYVTVQEWKVVRNLISSPIFDQEATCMPLEEPSTLLHAVCSIPTIPEDITFAVLNRYPQACKIEDEDGNLPIHLACTAPDMNPRVIEMLLLTCPETSFIPCNSDGDLPLYKLIRKYQHNKGSDAVFEFISNLPSFLIFNDHTSLLHQVNTALLPSDMICNVVAMYPSICKIHLNGNTLLHMMCSHEQSTASTVRLIMDKYPEACAIRDDYGNLPLHLVNSSTESLEIIRMLVQAYPEALLVQNAASEIPLVSPLIRCSSHRVKEILKHCQILGDSFHNILLHRSNFHGMTTVHAFFYALQKHLTHLISHNIIPMDQISSFGKMAYTNLVSNDIESLFYVMRYAVYRNVEYTSTTTHKDSFWVTFPLFSKILLNHSPELACHEDCNGNLPLHVIASHRFQNLNASQCHSCAKNISGPHLWHANNARICSNCHAKCGMKSSLSPHIDYEGHELIKDILAINPRQAYVPDSNGNLPLHLSLRSGKTWCTGVRELIQIAPSTLDVKDKATSLYPFMLAATGESEIPTSQKLTTIYELLRRDPSQIQC